MHREIDVPEASMLGDSHPNPVPEGRGRVKLRPLRRRRRGERAIRPFADTVAKEGKEENPSHGNGQTTHSGGATRGNKPERAWGEHAPGAGQGGAPGRPDDGAVGETHAQGSASEAATARKTRAGKYPH